MKHITKLLTVSLVSLTLAACSTSKRSNNESVDTSSESQSETEVLIETPTKATVKTNSYINNNKTYSFSFELTKEMLLQDSSIFSKDLALFAFGTALANQNEDTIMKFYRDAKFTSTSFNIANDVGDDKTSISYTCAYKQMGEIDLISISIRGFNYGNEWEDNFYVGTSGEHNGFAACANAVFADLNDFLVVAGNNKAKTKVLISGYSRGGAVANLLAKRIIDSESVTAKENVYAYTFEAPMGANERGSYNNIFNVVNSADIITSFAPTEYGFTRYGTDVDIYSSSLDEQLAEFDSDTAFPTYQDTLKSVAEDDVTLVNYIINNMLSYSVDDDSSPKPARTREEYCNNYQETFCYLLNMVFSLDSATLNSIKTEFANMTMWQKAALLGDGGLYNFIKPHLDLAGYQYNDSELQNHCTNAQNFITGPGTSVVMIALVDGALSRLIMHHYPEINYVLLNNYQVSE